MPVPKGKLGQRLRDARTLAGLSVASIAGAIGVAPMTVYRWEYGLHEPQLATLHKFAEATRTDPAWLVTGLGSPRPAPRKRTASSME